MLVADILEDITRDVQGVGTIWSFFTIEKIFQLLVLTSRK